MDSVKKFLKNLNNKKFAIGFSGGNDSSCLTLLIKEIGFKIIPVFVRTELTKSSFQLAKKNSELLGLNLEIIDIKVFSVKDIRFNTKLRCYYCKKLIYSSIKNKFNDFIIIDGTNYSDTFSYRPGIRALNELGIISPFKECKIEKVKIMEYIERNLPELKTLPESCPATKYPYDTDLVGKI